MVGQSYRLGWVTGQTPIGPAVSGMRIVTATLLLSRSPRASHVWFRMQRCVVQRGIKNGGPSWNRVVVVLALSVIKSMPPS